MGYIGSSLDRALARREKLGSDFDRARFSLSMFDYVDNQIDCLNEHPLVYAPV